MYSFIISEVNGLQILPEILTDHGDVWNLQNLLMKNDWNPQLILFLKVGICGGFTTFSSFALETNQLMERGAGWWAMFYVALSVIGALAAVYAAQYAVVR